MIKLFTVILIIATGSLGGIYKYLNYKERKKLLVDFQNMILHLETEINYFKEPLPNIFYKLSDDLNRESQIVLKETADLFLNENVDLKKAWEQSIGNVYKDKSLKKGDLDIFNKVGGFIGQSDIDGQKSHFELIKEEIGNEIVDSDYEMKTKGLMFAKMGVSLSIIIAIIFI